MKQYGWYLRYNIGNAIIKLGQMALPQGHIKRELELILISWRDLQTSRKFRKMLQDKSKEEVAGLIHQIASLRLDGLISDYEARFVESARKYMPARYERLLACIITDFHYSGYTLSDEEIRIILKNLLDRRVLIYTGDWMITEPKGNLIREDLHARKR